MLHYDWQQAMDTPMPMIEAGRRGFFGTADKILSAIFPKKKKGPRRAGPDEPIPLRSKSAMLNWAQRTNSRFKRRDDGGQAIGDSR